MFLFSRRRVFWLYTPYIAKQIIKEDIIFPAKNIYRTILLLFFIKYLDPGF